MMRDVAGGGFWWRKLGDNVRGDTGGYGMLRDVARGSGREIRAEGVR